MDVLLIKTDHGIERTIKKKRKKPTILHRVQAHFFYKDSEFRQFFKRAFTVCNPEKLINEINKIYIYRIARNDGYKESTINTLIMNRNNKKKETSLG